MVVNMNWEKYLKQMAGWDQVTLDPRSFVQLEHATPISPKEYLEFADKDLLLANTHGLVNALSNAKRAINCQITSLLAVLGLQNASDLQTKIQRFEEIGILTPRVSKKISSLESLLENQFSKPGMEEVEDAINIATLFVDATDKVFREFMVSWWVIKEESEKQNNTYHYKEGNKTFIVNDDAPKNDYSDALYVQYDQESGDYCVWGYLSGEEVFEAEVECSSPLDIEFIKCSILTHSKSAASEQKQIAADFVCQIQGKKGIQELPL